MGYAPGILSNGAIAPTTTASAIRSSIGAIGGSLGSTANRLLRTLSTGGATAQNSAITVDDSGNMSGVGFLDLTNGIRTRAGSFGYFSSVELTLQTNGILSFGGQAALTQDASNIHAWRNGTNAQIGRIYKTFTSATNAEFAELDCSGNTTTFDLAICSGSAGGSNRGFRIGSKFAGGAFSPWLSISNTGVATFSQGLAITPPVNGGFDVTAGNYATCNLTAASTAGAVMVLTTGTNQGTYGLYGDGISLWGLNRNGWLAVGCITGTGTLIGSPGVVRYHGTNHLFRTQNNGGLGQIECGDVLFAPSSSRTLSTNGQFTIEMTSNTAGNLVYRGSDGTTRRMALTFS